MKPNAINYLSLAKKAGRIEIGEESAGAAARACHARLLLVAKDAPDGALRRARNFVAGSGQQLAVVPFPKRNWARPWVKRSIPGRHHRPCPGPGLFAGSGGPPAV